MSYTPMIISEETIKNKIYIIRGQRVMLDMELAEIYGYTTKAFNQQVKNNIHKFDDDFRFQLTKDEWANLRSKKLTSSWGGTRYLPYVQITLQQTGGRYHDRFIMLDYGSEGQRLYHCGGSSKDGGSRVTAISPMDDVSLYQPMFEELLQTPTLVLR